MNREEFFSLLNFGATVWLALGSMLLTTLALYSRTPIDWTFVYVVCIALLTVKMALIFRTDEILSLQHLTK